MGFGYQAVSFKAFTLKHRYPKKKISDKLCSSASTVSDIADAEQVFHLMLLSYCLLGLNGLFFFLLLCNSETVISNTFNVYLNILCKIWNEVNVLWLR